MNLWHKRVIIFLLKFFGVIIIIAGITLFLYYNFYFKKDNLLKYAPKNSVVFASFRLSEGISDNQAIASIIQKVQNKYSLDIDFDIINPLVGYNAAFAVIPNSNLDYLFIVNLKSEVKDLTQLEKILLKNNLYYEYLTHDRIEKNILIVSNSLDVINQVKKINVQEAPSLADRVNVVLNFKAIPISYKAKAFIDVEAINELVSQTDNFNLKMVLANFPQKELYLNMEEEENEIIIKSFRHDSNKNKEIISGLVPDNFLVNLNLNDVNFAYSDYLSKVRKINKNSAEIINQYITYYQELYDFNLQQDILNILDQQSQFIITEDDYWLILADLSQNSEIQEKVAKIEHIIKEHLAYNNPEVVEKKLPDNTYIKQIVKQTNGFEFKIEDIKGINLSYLQKNGEEYAYFIIDDVIYFANNKQILANLLNNTDYMSLEDESNCYKKLPNFRQNFLIRSSDNNKLGQINDYFKYILLAQQNTTDEIWLCLE